MNRYTIKELREEIEQRLEEPLTDGQFRILLSGFRARSARQGLFSPATVDNAVNKGWMSAQMAHFFKAYALE